MRRSRFSEAQIIGMLKEQEAGLATADVCRKYGLRPATFYKLKAKFGVSIRGAPPSFSGEASVICSYGRS